MSKRILTLLLSVIMLVSVLAVGVVPASAVSEFTISEECLEIIKTLEGFKSKPYWDHAHYSIGYGTSCPSDKLEQYKAEGITQEQGDEMLREALAKFGKSVNSFADKNGLTLTQNQFDALLMFTYNVGNAWLFKEGAFRSAILNGVTGNEFLHAAGQWCNASGTVYTSLIRRRMMEANMYLNGVYSTTVPENYCYVLYYGNGGDSSLKVQCYDSNLTDTPKATATLEGDVFEGWYTAAEGGEKVTVLDASTRNKKLYAHWANGGETGAEQPETSGAETIDPVKVTVQANGVNIRKGPGTNYEKVGVVYSGKTMTITAIQTGTGYTWGQFDGGWIALSFTNYKQLTEQAPETTEPPATEPPATEPPATEPPATEPPATEPPATEPPATEPPAAETPAEEKKGTMGTVTGSDLRIRSGAGTGYKVLGYLQKGDRIEILDTKKVGSMTWGRFEKGWVSLSYVKLDQQEETPAAPAVPETKPETKPETTPETKPAETKMTGTVKVNDFLRIRKGAGTGYAVAGYLSRGAKVEILETKQVGATTWGRISQGWISLDYVVLDKTETEAQPETKPETVTKTVKVNDCLRIRSGAGTGYKVVGFLYNGAKVQILETKVVNGTAWGRISKGWISMDYVV